MRLVLLVGAVIAAVLIPVTSIAPRWIAESTSQGATATYSPSGRLSLAARLSPALGIVPLSIQEQATGTAGASIEVARRAKKPGFFAESSFLPPGKNGSNQPPNVHCENGVCLVVDPESGDPNRRHAVETKAPNVVGYAPRPGLTWEQARRSLINLGATGCRLEMSSESGRWYFSCSVPLNGPESTPKVFQAVADDEMNAVADVLAQIERTRTNRF